MLNSVLNIAEQDELNRISGSLTLDSYTRTLAINFLAEYKQKIRAVILFAILTCITSIIRSP